MPPIDSRVFMSRHRSAIPCPGTRPPRAFGHRHSSRSPGYQCPSQRPSVPRTTNPISLTSSLYHPITSSSQEASPKTPHPAPLYMQSNCKQALVSFSTHPQPPVLQTLNAPLSQPLLSSFVPP